MNMEIYAPWMALIFKTNITAMIDIHEAIPSDQVYPVCRTKNQRGVWDNARDHIFYSSEVKNVGEVEKVIPLLV